MVNPFAPNAPSLGGQPVGVSGREPGLSRDHRPERLAEVAALMQQHRSNIVHDRFYATLALGEYPDHPRAVAAAIRSSRDDSRMVRLAAIFALEQMIPRAASASLRRHGIAALDCILQAGPFANLNLPSVSLRLLLQDRGWQQSSAGRALAAQIVPMLRDQQPRSLPLYLFARRALRAIGTPDALAINDPWLVTTAPTPE